MREPAAPGQLLAPRDGAVRAWFTSRRRPGGRFWRMAAIWRRQPQCLLTTLR